MKASAQHLLPALVAALVLAACGSTSDPADSAQASPAGAAAVPSSVKAVIATDHGPSAFAVDASAIYVANHRGGTLQRIDPTTNRITASVSIGGQVNITNGEPPTWACTNTDGQVHRIDVTSMTVVSSTPAGCDGGSLSVIGTTVWSVPGGDAGDRQQVVLLDAGTGKRISSFPMPSGARGGPAVPAGRAVVIGGGSGAPTYTPAGKALVDRGVDLSWLVQPIAGRLYRVPESGLITELDPTTMTTVDTIAAPPHHGDWNWALAGDGKGHLWYRPDYTHLYQVDIVSKKVSLILTLPWEEAPTGIWYAFDSLWVSNFDADTVWRVDVSG